MSSMSIHTFIAVAPHLPASTSILVRGPHGIGKSQVARQFAEIISKNEKLENYKVIDRRLSQLTEGDIIGLPSTDGETTRFNPPDWYKQACDSPCFLFLDELNRATPEVMQAAFQIVLDRELNGWKLHPQTRVMSAVNNSANYTVNEIDPALLDRFWTIDLTPDAKDWLNWARTENSNKSCGFNVMTEISEFIAQNEKWLDPPSDANPGEVHVSRRSWERLSDALSLSKLDAENSLAYSLSVGYVGVEASIALIEFMKNNTFKFNAEDILNNFKKIEKKLFAEGRHDYLNDAISKLVAHFKTAKPIGTDKSGKTIFVTEKQGKNLNSFMKKLTHELRIVLWQELGNEVIEVNTDVITDIGNYILAELKEVYGIFKEGDDPVVPSFMENNTKAA